MKVLSAKEASAVLSLNGKTRRPRTVVMLTHSEEAANGYLPLCKERGGGVFRGTAGNRESGYYEAWVIYWTDPPRRKPERPAALCEAWLEKKPVS